MAEQILEQYRTAVEKKKTIEADISKSQAVLEEKERAYQEACKEVFEKYGVKSIEELKALMTSKAQEIKGVVEYLEKTYPEALVE